MSKKNPKLDITGHQNVITALGVARAKQDAYLSTLIEHEPILDPENNAKAHRRAIEQEGKADRIVELAEKMNSLSGPGLAAAKARAEGICGQAQLALRATMTPLLDAAFDVLAELRTEARLAESEFLCEFGLAYEVTGVSRRLDKMEFDLKNFRDGLAVHQAFLILVPNAFAHYLDWFTAE